MKRLEYMTLAVACIVLATAGCLVGPNYQPPELDVPDAWHAGATAGVAEGDAAMQTWWDAFDDRTLVSLLQRAERSNLDLAIAVARIREARASYRVTSGDRWPAVELQGSAGATGLTENDGGGTIENYGLGVGVSWELDVFGRVRRSIEAADASVQASIEDYRDVLVVLLAEVGSNYVESAAFQARLALTNDNIEAQRESLQLTRDRFDAGLTSALDVAQAESNLATTEARIPPLQTQLNAALTRLAVLLGETPGSLHEELLGRNEIPSAPELDAVGIPAEVLRQRPDIRSAERNLAAQTASIGVAQADLYPRFSLSGFLGIESGDISDLLDGDAVTWSINIPVVGNLFDRGRRKGRVEIAEARAEQLVASYERAILVALKEVEDAMVAFAQESQRSATLERAVDATERSVELVRERYRAGLTDFQNVLDSERSLTEQQDQLAQSRGRVVTNLIALYRALGGGWTNDESNLETFTSATGIAER
jgi:NodT family efflux transporter outer membrane factor (OMF) lipoprotein